MSLDQAIADLRALLDSRAHTSVIQREHHSRGESYHAAGLPDVVCFPHTTEEVSEILKISARHGLPVVPFGAGSSVEGHVNAIHGGITISLREMNRVLRVSVDDLDATVEAGVTRVQLCKALENTGLTFFVDPGADATLGGMAATRASGTTSVRYGTMSANVLGLTVVLADGRIIRTGSRARKSSAGYDLTHLFVGSEGTLGVITEVTLRLHPYPEAVVAAVCHFPDAASAVNTAIEAMQLGLSVARIEFLDENQMAAINRYAKTNHAVRPTLFVEVHGSSERAVAEQAGMLQTLAGEHGGDGFLWKNQLLEREELWKARHHAYYSTLALRPGGGVWTTDVCVPISRLAECITETQADNATASIPSTIVSHVGDGNFHVLYALDPTQPAEIDEAHRLTDRMVRRALAMGGTCTGEHGVGSGKMKYLPLECGEALEVMKTIKRALDPDNRMNPGKVVAA